MRVALGGNRSAGSCLRLEHTKTGRSIRPIGSAAKEVLRSITKVSDKWVFPNNGDTGSADFKKTIATLFNAAGLHDARSHDLRRTFGSIALMRAMGIPPLANCWAMPAAASPLATISGDPMQP